MSSKETAAIHIRQGGEYQDNRIQKNIVVAGNTVRGSGSWAMIARGVSGLTVSDNQFSDYWNREPVPLGEKVSDEYLGWQHGVVIESCDDVVYQNNIFTDPGEFALSELFTAEVTPSSKE